MLARYVTHSDLHLAISEFTAEGDRTVTKMSVYNEILLASVYKFESCQTYLAT